MRTYKIKPQHVIDGLESVIEKVVDQIYYNNEMPWYDPNDPFSEPLLIEDIMMVLNSIADEEFTTTKDSYLAPRNIIMFKGSWGEGGLHKDLLDIIAYEVNKKKINNCTHPNKYKNQVSRTLSFWVCPDCKEEV